MLWMNGTIIWRRHYYPGSWDDRETSRALQIKLRDERFIMAGMGLADDSVFSVMVAAVGNIVTPLKEGDLDREGPGLHLGIVTG